MLRRSQPPPVGNIVELRIHLTGSRRRDLGYGVLAGLEAWGLGWVVFRLFNPLVGFPRNRPWRGFGISHLVTGAVLLALFTAAVLLLARKHYARRFLAPLLVTAAMVPPVLGTALLVLFLCHHDAPPHRNWAVSVLPVRARVETPSPLTASATASK